MERPFERDVWVLYLHKENTFTVIDAKLETTLYKIRKHFHYDNYHIQLKDAEIYDNELLIDFVIIDKETNETIGDLEYWPAGLSFDAT